MITLLFLSSYVLFVKFHTSVILCGLLFNVFSFRRFCIGAFSPHIMFRSLA
jgi:hypothetical protein